MSIHQVARHLSDLLGQAGPDAVFTMRYEDGGKVEVYHIGDRQVRVKAGLSDPADTARSIREAFNSQNPPRN